MKKKSYTYSIILIVFTLLFGLVGTIIHFKKTESLNVNDFEVYYLMSERASNHDWNNIYTRDDGSMPFRYAPYTIPTLNWMNSFEKVTAKKIWFSLQASCFVIGFFILFKVLKNLKAPTPLFSICITFLMTSKYYLDALFSGQVAGMIFLFFSLGLYYYIKEKDSISISFQFIPTTLKIMPGISLIQILATAKNKSKRLEVVSLSALLFIVSNFLFLIWLKINSFNQDTFAIFLNLWKKWVMIVLADGEYYDATSSKSQSLRSLILRTLGASSTSEIIWKIFVLFVLVALILNWSVAKPKNTFQRAYSYSLGILGFIIIMPQSLPYALVNLAIPLSLLVCSVSKKSSTIHKILIAAFFFILSLASSDIIGYHNAQWVLCNSLPCMVIIFLTGFVYYQAWPIKISCLRVCKNRFSLFYRN